MEKNMKKENKVALNEKEHKRQSLFHRFLKWISKGTEKATRDGSFCNT